MHAILFTEDAVVLAFKDEWRVQEGDTLVLTCCAGAGLHFPELELSYSWNRSDGAGFPVGRTHGVDTSTLFITGMEWATDLGGYSCVIGYSGTVTESDSVEVFAGDPHGEITGCTQYRGSV